MKMKLIFVAALALGVSACGVPQQSQQAFADDGFDFEVEDCDREDALKGQRGECSQRQIDEARRKHAAKNRAYAPSKSKPTYGSTSYSSPSRSTSTSGRSTSTYSPSRSSSSSSRSSSSRRR